MSGKNRTGWQKAWSDDIQPRVERMYWPKCIYKKKSGQLCDQLVHKKDFCREHENPNLE